MKTKVSKIILLLTVFMFASLTGCTSATQLFGYLKFWERRGETVSKTDPDELAGFFDRIRPVKGNSESHYLLGVHYQERGRYKEAIEEFTKVIGIDRKHVQAYNAIGICFDNLKEFDKAHAAYNIALQLAPDQQYIYNNLAYSWVLRGEHTKAIEILRKALALGPQNEIVQNNLNTAIAGLNAVSPDYKSLIIAKPDKIEKPLDRLADVLPSRGEIDEHEFVARTRRSIENTRSFPTKENNSLPSSRSKGSETTDDVTGKQFVTVITDGGLALNNPDSASMRANPDQITNRPASVKKVKAMVTSPARTRILIHAPKIIKTVALKNPKHKLVAVDRRILKVVDLRITKLEPDFLMNKNHQSTVQAKPNEPADAADVDLPLLKQLFPVRYVRTTRELSRQIGYF